jgi:hypothetical protein
MIDDFYKLIPIATKKDYQTMLETHGYVDVTPNGRPIVAIVPDEPIRYMTILEFENNVPRGNHLHRSKHEFMIPICGALRAKLWLPDKLADSVEITLRPGQILHILPNCAHSLTAINGDATAIEYSPQAYDPDDTVELDIKDE